MEENPALIPLWQNVSLRERYNSGRCAVDLNVFPDHGGAGVDVKSNGDIVILKSSTPKVSFASKYCALPFFPPNKVKTLHDPCLDTLKEQQRKQNDFETRFEALRIIAKKKGKFRESLTQASAFLSTNRNVDEITVPKSVANLARIMPDEVFIPKGNWSYTGGCLAALIDPTYKSKTLLFHPYGEKMNQLAITPAIKQSNECRSVVPAINQQKVIKLKGGRIRQIEAETADNLRACCVRQKKTYHYINLDETSETADCPFQVESFSMEQEISSMAISPHVPGEYAVITCDGLLLIEDAETRNTLWQIGEPLQHDPVIKSEDSWWGCDFGAQPFEVLYMDRMKLSMIDLRMKNPLDILSLPNPFVLNDENLMVTKRLLNNPIQHLVATDHHLFILDERYPQQPIMSWNHSLKSVPLYSDVKCYRSGYDDSQYIVLLGSQESQEIASFYFQSQSYSKVQPLSLSPPLHLSTFRDCARSLSLHGIPLDSSINKRLSMPLIGVCSIPHFNQEGFTALQLSSIGDIFCQHFQLNDTTEEKTYRVAPGCILTPPEDILPDLNAWFDMARVADDKQEKKSLNYVDSSHVLRRILEHQYHQKRAKKCSICEGGLLLNDADKIDAQVCPSCGLDVDLSSQLIEKTENVGILAGHFSGQSDADTENHILNLVDLEKFTTGPLSEKILKVWRDDDSSLIQSPEKGKSAIPSSTSFEKYSEELERDVLNTSHSEEINTACSTKAMEQSSHQHHLSTSVNNPDFSTERLNSYDITLEDLIAPSQEERTLTGETLRTPGSQKKRKWYSSAGF